MSAAAGSVMMSGFSLDAVLTSPIPSIIATVLAVGVILWGVGQGSTGLSLDRIMNCTLAFFLSVGAVFLSTRPAAALPWLPTTLILLGALAAGLLVRWIDSAKTRRSSARMSARTSSLPAADD